MQSTTLDAETKTIEIENDVSPEREVMLTDAYYSGLPIEDGQITLTQE